MNLVPKFPKKVQFVLDFSFPLISTLCPRKAYVGGRIGYPKDDVFCWLLVKKITNWGYRTVAEMAGYSHSTLVRGHQTFVRKNVYQRLLRKLVSLAYRNGLIHGRKVALDASFVKTFSKRREEGSLGWNEWKEAYGFKLHALIDAETGVPIALIMRDGLTHESQVAIPLLRKARPWLKNVGYVLADKGYDDGDLVLYIAKQLKAKAGIPIKKTRKTKCGTRTGTFLNWKLKTKGRTLKKSIYNFRSEIERFFSHLKRTYHLGKEETRGFEAFMGNAYLACICFMLMKLYSMGVRYV